MKGKDLIQKLVQSGEKYTLMDVRQEHEFKSGSVSNAINVPLSNVSKFDKKDTGTIVVFCQSGMRSAQAASILKGKYMVINGGSWSNVAKILRNE